MFPSLTGIGTPSDTRAQVVIPDNIFDSLLPSLTKAPTIYNVGLDNPLQIFRDGDVFDVHILEVPKTSPDLHKFRELNVNDIIQNLRDSMPFVEIFNQDLERVDSPGDMRKAYTGWTIDAHDRSVDCFVLVVEWASEAAAARFKDPSVPNVYLEGYGVGTSGDARWHDAIYGPLNNFPGSDHRLDSVTTCIRRTIRR